MDLGLKYKYDSFFVNNNRKQNSLKKVEYRKTAIANSLQKYCNLSKKSVVLDIGFGQTDGIITQEIARKAKKAVGIEIDKNDVIAAKKINKMPNCFFLEGDARKLPFKDNYFDIISCVDVIEHIPENREKIFKEMKRVLKSEGHIYIALENKFILKEPHYGLYFLSCMPKKLADFYLALSKRGKSYDIVHWNYLDFKKQIKKRELKNG